MTEEELVAAEKVAKLKYYLRQRFSGTALTDCFDHNLEPYLSPHCTGNESWGCTHKGCGLIVCVQESGTFFSR